MTQINYINFERLKFLAKWAGIIAAVQSILWIGLAVVGVMSYYCVFDYSSTTKFDHLIGWTFYYLYFKGSCKIQNFPELNSSELDSAQSFESNHLHIFMWVYIVISFFWLCSSISMITHIKKDKLKRTIIILHVWVIFCFVICALDFALAVLFGLDYNNFNESANKISFSEKVEKVNVYEVLLITAQTVSISLMIIALRGFILWIINFSFMLYFGRETLIINELDSKETDIIHKQFASDSHSINSRPPISAFDTRNDIIAVTPSNSEVENTNINNNVNSNATSPVDEVLTIDNMSSIQRATLISNELLKERQSKFAQYDQYPPPVIKPEIAKKPQKPEPYNYLNGNRRITDPRFPEPDYSPVAPRKLLPIQKRSFQ